MKIFKLEVEEFRLEFEKVKLDILFTLKLVENFLELFLEQVKTRDDIPQRLSEFKISTKLNHTKRVKKERFIKIFFTTNLILLLQEE